jgi:hypothetical protein
MSARVAQRRGRPEARGSRSRSRPRPGVPAGSPPSRGFAHQVPDAQQDGAGADMAAQTAAVGVEPRPGRDHLHRSGRGRSGSSTRPSLRKRCPRRPGPSARLLAGSSAAPAAALVA